jgi:hypothetical protein
MVYGLSHVTHLIHIPLLKHIFAQLRQWEDLRAEN